MNCAWQAYIELLPHWMREDVNILGKDKLQELRLRVGRLPVLILRNDRMYLERLVSRDDINYCINAASEYSPWSAASISSGFITARGGHRIGICGDIVIVDGKVSTIASVTSLCIRVARDFLGIGKEIGEIDGSTLIIGPPGSGKTTLLRDVIRHKSNYGKFTVAVVDERREIFPVVNGGFCFQPGMHTDVLSGSEKMNGTEQLLRTMCPDWLAVDEITNEADCQALIRAGWCGVSLLATAHAENREALFKRMVYKPILESGVFENLIVLQGDKSWSIERMGA